MTRTRLRVLLIVEQCNPDWPSVPGEGFHLARSVSAVADVTLVTHERNQRALERAIDTSSTVFIPEWRAIRWYYRLASLLAVRDVSRVRPV